MARLLFLTVVLILLTAQAGIAQFSPSAVAQPMIAIEPPSPGGLTPMQRLSIQQLLDAFFGSLQPQDANRTVEEKMARLMVKDALAFLEAKDFEKARFLVTKAMELKVAFGPDEQSPEQVLGMILRANGQALNSPPPSVLPTIPIPISPPPIPGGSPFPHLNPDPMMARTPTLPTSPLRFAFKIDAKTPVTTLLPTPPKTAAKLPAWTNEDLTKVPELTIGEPIAKNLDKMKSLEATAYLMAKVNHLNAKKTDGFMLALLENRSELRGMPFRMGEECRTGEDQSKMFALVVNSLHQMNQQLREQPELTDAFLDQGLAHAMKLLRSSVTINRGNEEQFNRAAVAAMTQILMPEPEIARLCLAKSLATIPHVDATKALARLALYSPEERVRAAAIEGLKTRREKDYTDVLLTGFHYPLPAVSKRAAEALVKLERKDLLANLIEVLEAPDPRLPYTREGSEGKVVRELVKINHHRNCVLCHAPGNSENVPQGVLTVAVPLPSEPLPKPAQGGYQSVQPASPDIVVRLDMTYLRQDFSLMMPVPDAHPWPEMQRFDFLVRTREVTEKEAQAYEVIEEPGRLSPYHRSALFALRELTGRDTEPTAAAWRKLLKR